MTAIQLLRLYPRQWRERYGEEFLSTVGDQALHLQQIVDIVAGAIDARLSPSVRRQLRAAANGGRQGDSMQTTMKAMCSGSHLRYTKRDSLIGAGVMLVGSLTTAIAAILLKRRGYSAAGEFIGTNGFFFALVVSMPFWVLKGQPWRAQVVLIGGTLLMLSAATWLAGLI